MMMTKKFISGKTPPSGSVHPKYRDRGGVGHLEVLRRDIYEMASTKLKLTDAI